MTTCSLCRPLASWRKTPAAEREAVDASIIEEMSSGFTAENELAARVGELYVNDGGVVCGRLTLKAKSQRAKFI
jgi:hypothetical protein